MISYRYKNYDAFHTIHSYQTNKRYDRADGIVEYTSISKITRYVDSHQIDQSSYFKLNKTIHYKQKLDLI